MKTFRSFISAVLVILVAAGSVCGLSASAKAAVKLNKKSLTLKIGSSYTLKLLNNNKKKIKWKTSDKKIAAVTSKGKVTAKKAGKATVSATVGKKIYKCSVKVKKQPVTKVRLSKSSIVLNKNDFYWLTATVSPKTASSKKLKWTSSKTNVASVNSKGRITAKGQGTATIKATATDGSKKSASCKVTVLGNDPKKAFTYLASVISDYYTGINEDGNKFISVTSSEEISNPTASTAVFTSGVVYCEKENALRFLVTADYPMDDYDVHSVSEIEIKYSDIAHSYVSQWAVFKLIQDDTVQLNSDMQTTLDNSRYKRSEEVTFDLNNDLPEPMSEETEKAFNTYANSIMRLNLRGAQSILNQCGTSLEELGFTSY